MYVCVSIHVYINKICIYYIYTQKIRIHEEIYMHISCVCVSANRYKAAAVAASVIRRSHPQTPAQRLVGWIDHILQTGGGAHLKPHAFQQPWYERYLLDVVSFLLVLTLGTMWLCGKLLGLAARWLCGARKLKKA